MTTRIGRSIDAVLNPKNYPPFAEIPTALVFEHEWQHNPAAILANMAHAAYCAPDDMEPLLARLGAGIRFYSSRDSNSPIIRGRQAFLATWADKAILAFRGTEGSETIHLKTPAKLRSAARKIGWTLPDALDTFLATDLLDDLNFGTTPYRNARVHRGFLEATLELWPAIEKDLNRLPPPDRLPVYATGHSLGGAMAVIAGMMHAFEGIVTFGEPRVGQNLQQALVKPDRHVRYVNGNDPVPLIVPTVYPFSYRHHGALRTIVDHDHGGPNVLYDHSIVNYAEILGETSPDAE